MKHREAEEIDNALEVILKASKEAVENLHPILKEEVQKVRGMENE